MEEMLLVPDNIPVPDFDPERQYLGEPEKGKDGTWFFPVINYTPEELIKLAEYKLAYNRKLILDQKSHEIALSQFQELTDPTELSKVKEVFPLWSPDKEYKNPKEKVTRILPNGEIELYELGGKATKETAPEKSKSGWNKII